MKWYNVIQNIATPTVTISGEIGAWGVSHAAFVRDTKDLESFDLHINSGGGDLTDGIAIFNYLRSKDVTVIIDGLAASAASIIAMGGKRIKMCRGSMMMIHNPFAMVVGESSDFLEIAATMQKFEGQIAAIYASRTGIEQTEILRMMNESTWLTDEEAFAAKFCDEIEERLAVACSIAPTRFIVPHNAQHLMPKDEPEPIITPDPIVTELQNKLENQTAVFVEKYNALVEEMKAKNEAMQASIQDAVASQIAAMGIQPIMPLETPPQGTTTPSVRNELQGQSLVIHYFKNQKNKE